MKTNFILVIKSMIIMSLIICFNCCKVEDENKTDPAICTDIDGNTYRTVIIGTQTWMAENLRVTRYNDGTTIPNVVDADTWANLTTGAYCNYNNDESYVSTYGRLYNWCAVNAGKLCPQGWHVPTEEEWTTLSAFLGGEDSAGGKMKTVTGWSNPNVGASNSSNFSGLPGGSRNQEGTFHLVGEYGFWWSSTGYTEGSSSYAWYKRLINDGTDLFSMDLINKYGFSIRCISDN